MKRPTNTARIARSLPLALLAGMLAVGHANAEGNAENGEKVFKKCMACHTIGEGQPSRQGPNLHNILGRPIASLEGFRYSKVYQEAGETGETLSLIHI